jgi:DNA-binding NarL/FixJ family response regulator
MDREESTFVGGEQRPGRAAPPLPATDPRQTRVLLLVKGLSEKEIGNRLEISPHTVHNHIIASYRVFEVHSRSVFLVSIFREPL